LTSANGIRDIVNTLVRCSSNRISVVVFIPRNWLNIGTKEKYAFINLVDLIEDFFNPLEWQDLVALFCQ